MEVRLVDMQRVVPRRPRWMHEQPVGQEGEAAEVRVSTSSKGRRRKWWWWQSGGDAMVSSCLHLKNQNRLIEIILMYSYGDILCFL